MEWLVLLISLVIILGGAELFTNGIEWVGEGFGLSEGAVGSVLAAVGTALPETLLPIVAILFGHGSGQDIGVGAILGAPFMLSTLAMFAMGVTVVVNARRGKRSMQLEHDPGVFQQDLRYFMVVYTLAILAGVIHIQALNYILAAGLVVGYGFYVRRHFTTPGEKEMEAEAVGEVKPLFLSKRVLRRGTATPEVWQSITQSVAGLVVIVAGADLFVGGVSTLAERLHVPDLIFALLVAPLATELPEALNASVIWAGRGKDVLALGNITGAMVFQATFPVAIGLLFTPWRLDLPGWVSAVVALAASLVMFLEAKFRGQLEGKLLLLQGVFYAGFVVFVLIYLA